MTNLPHIRLASRDDALAVKLISDENDLSGSDAGFVLEPMDENHTWIVLEDATAKITGAAYFGPESHSDRVWNLYFLAVAKQCQGMGVGSALVTYVELNLQNRGEDVANLLLIETSSAESFEKTRGFYRKQGYVEEARIRDYYGPNDDKIVFWKRLHKLKSDRHK